MFRRRAVGSLPTYHRTGSAGPQPAYNGAQKSFCAVVLTEDWERSFREQQRLCCSHSCSMTEMGPSVLAGPKMRLIPCARKASARSPASDATPDASWQGSSMSRQADRSSAQIASPSGISHVGPSVEKALHELSQGFRSWPISIPWCWCWLRPWVTSSQGEPRLK